MATAMGADIVAEGVENIAQLAQLSTLDCHRAQGYLFSRPVQAIDVPNVVQAIQDPTHWRELTGNN